MTGRTIGSRYCLAEKLGSGGMGSVYRATDLQLKRSVAVKVLNPDIAANPKAAKRFKGEATTLAQVNHSNVATLLDVSSEGRELFMIMEFIPGRTLDSLIREGGAMPIDIALPLFCQILDGIGSAHQAGITHRDIKPANVILTKDGVPKVIDFGIARVETSTGLTAAGVPIGTVEYMSPEQALGDELDARSDIYSLGIVLFEMLSGKVPFDKGSVAATMRAQIAAPPPKLSDLRPDLAPALVEVVDRSLAKEPGDRFPNTQAFRDAIEACVDTRIFHKPPIAAFLAKVSEPARAERPARGKTVVEVDEGIPADATLPAVHSSKLDWKVYAAVAVLALVAVAGVWVMKMVTGRRATPPAPAVIQTGTHPSEAAQPVVETPATAPSPALVVETAPPVVTAPDPTGGDRARVGTGTIRSPVREHVATPAEGGVASSPRPAKKPSAVSAEDAEIEKQQAELRRKQAEEAANEKKRLDALRILSEPAREQKK